MRRLRLSRLLWWLRGLFTTRGAGGSIIILVFSKGLLGYDWFWSWAVLWGRSGYCQRWQLGQVLGAFVLRGRFLNAVVGGGAVLIISCFCHICGRIFTFCCICVSLLIDFLNFIGLCVRSLRLRHILATSFLFRLSLLLPRRLSSLRLRARRRSHLRRRLLAEGLGHLGLHLRQLVLRRLLLKLLLRQFILVFYHLGQRPKSFILVSVLWLLVCYLLEAVLIRNRRRCPRITHPHVLHDLLHLVQVTVLRSQQHGLSGRFYEILLLY